jgi:hypothetical protein
VASPACTVFQHIGGTATVDISRATVRRMTVGLRKDMQAQTICPREQTQLVVAMTVVPEGGSTEKTYETYAGRGAVNKNDHLEFTPFAFESEQGKFDAEGWFAPIQSVAATAGKEFVVRATYTLNPTVYSYTYKWKPDYACITATGSAGEAGFAGGPGGQGAPGRPGDGGGVMSSGGDGQDGAKGITGGDGSSGGLGPKILAEATYVKTPFYDKLIAIKLIGGVNDLLFVVPGRPFVIHANGGPGGSGGVGGKGGTGGPGAAGNPGGHGGIGGTGGTGGKGGNGGAGGTIDLLYDARFPDLATAITLDVAGGQGASGGKGGPGGEPGPGGKGMAPVNSPQVPVDGAKGHEGNDGSPGYPGRQGQNGSVAVHSGTVGAAFAGLADVTVLTSLPSGPAAPAAAPATHPGH